MVKDFWTIDSETDPFEHGLIPLPFIWGAYNGRTGEYIEFNTTEEIIKFMQLRGDIFYAHNGGKYDFHYLADGLTRNKNVLMIHNRLVKANLGLAELRDSYSLLPFPLKAYKKDDIDYNKLHAKVRHKHMPEIRKYLKNDCIYLWDLIAAFFAEYGRHLTAPGAAIKTLCKIEDIKIENSGQGFFNEFKKHYFGGRCECLAPGSYKENLNYFDIRSAYPFAMMHQHPTGEDWEFKYYDKPPIIPHAFYTIEARSFGALCRREKGGLKFDHDGEIRTYNTTGWEIKAGLETETLEIVSHIEQKFFAQSRTFEKFVNHFWEERRKWPKNSPQNLFAKLMLNSAYGKFASNPQEYDTFVLYDPEIAEWLTANDWEIRGEVGKHLICSKPMEPDYMRFYNVATAASITGFVRSMLIRAISGVEHAIYCDTDSLVFTGKNNIKLSDNLGGWQTEGEFVEGHFAGKKLYTLKYNTPLIDKETGKKTTHKISSKGAILDHKQIKKIAEGKTVTYKQAAPSFSWVKKADFVNRDNPINKKLFLERKIKKTAC